QTIYSDPITGVYSIDLVSETEHTFEVTSVVSGYEPLVETVTPTTDALTHDIGLGIDGEVCAAPGYQPDYDFFWSFEQSDGGFTSGGTNSSWAWGDFTSGPGEGHSGTKGIATNPAGNYNNYEESWMVSPVIDLSGFGTNTPVLQWWDWLFVESVTSNWDWAFLQVTKDGTNWTTVWGPDKRQDSAYSQQTAVLDPSYNVSTFQFRFSFHSDVSGVYPGWYVDDVGIVEIAAPLPTVLYSSDFESNDGGFVVGGTSPSWEVGKPTSGPEAAHSGLVVWATNLAGDYNSSEDSYITSPLIDLSANPTLAPTISFYHWMQSESNSYDWGAVEATKDGGVTWDIVWQKFGNITEWTPKSLQLDSSYAVSNFQFRFHFHSDGSVNYPGWYIDDVSVSVAEPFVIAAPCVVIPGGAVAGYVTDEMTDEPIIGADVYSDRAATQSFVLEDDPGNAGIYWLFQPTETDPQDVLFTASKALYADETATVSVVQDAVTQQDFALGTGELTFDPTEFEFTMDMGDEPATDTLTIGNNGTSDATFELVEKDQGFTPLNIPAFTGELPKSNQTLSLGPAPKTTSGPIVRSTKNDLGGILSTAPAYAMDVYPGENLVYIPDTTVPGTWEVVGSITGMSFFAGDFVGGDFDTMYVVNYDNNGLYAVDTATGAYTQIGTTTPPLGTISGLSGTPDGTMYGIAGDCTTSYLVTVDITSGATTNIGAISGVGCGIDLAYNTNNDMIYVVDLLTSSLFRVDPVTAVATLVGSLGVSPNYAQGMDFEEESGVLYWAAYTTSGELRVIDTTTGASTSIGAFPGGAEVDCLAFPTGGSADVPWLSEDPVSGTVTAGETAEVTITVDPSSLGQPGDYAAALKVKHNTPYTYPNIPVILHLVAPEDFGTINGTVYGLEACDINPAPIKGATVNFKQGDDIKYTTTTLANGYYSYSMPEGEYDIEVIAEGFVSQTVTGVDVVGGSTVTQDFELRLLAPCLSAVPSELEKTLVVDQIGTQSLTLVNTGTVDVDIELIEMDQTPGAQAQISIPAFTGQLPADSQVASMGPAPKVGNAPAASDAKNDLDGILAGGAPAFAVDVYPGGNVVHIPDILVPGTWTVVGSTAGKNLYAGDFLGGDTSILYAINDDNKLYAIDTDTAAATLIGTTNPPAGTSFTGLSGAPDGTMYGLTSTCSVSYLVTVDVTTGLTTSVGTLSGVGCGIDLAFNTNDGMIYTVDLLTDNVYKIDPETAEVTLVGSTGISANYAQGMDYEEESGVLYWAAFNYSTDVGELRIIDTTTGASTLIGMFPGGAETDCLAFTTGGISDVQWLSEDPVAGTVPAGGSLPITVTFDATGLDASDYFAGLRVRPDGAPKFDVPVTLHVVELWKLYLPLIAK
nr:carboxypeptidase regulatory-like domain-containing protein [Anaerolineaceae bacterium]